MGRTQARLADVLAALTLAMDLGLGLPVEWVLRCTLTGMRLVEAMELDDQVGHDVFYLSLLRHIGCTSMSSEFAHFFGTDQVGPEVVLADPKSLSDNIALIASMGAGDPLVRRLGAMARMMRAPSIEVIDETQCDAACRLAAGMGIEQRLIECLRQSRERWDGKGSPAGLKGDEIDLAVRVTHVAQDMVLAVDVLGADRGPLEVEKRAGGLLDPDVVVFIDAIEIPTSDEPIWDEVVAIEPKPPREVEISNQVLGAFADFADLKSTYLLGHSRRVASLAASGGEQMGLTRDEIEELRLAGLVHDLGRVAISTSVWEKPARLTALETEQVRLHPYYTERILSRSRHLAYLADTASSHHEQIDGGGYHRGVKGPALSMKARILAAADLFSSLCEQRPHRPALDPESAASEMSTRVRDGHLDSHATEAVLAVSGSSFDDPSARERLTPRELEVLRLAARGQTIREIADRLVISKKTADRHVQNLYTKLGISNRAAAAIWAMEHGLI
jgi:HD-GYP domain-containing protein (c-di-GMP phosphodiesterase class II)